MKVLKNKAMGLKEVKEREWLGQTGMVLWAMQVTVSMGEMGGMEYSREQEKVFEELEDVRQNHAKMVDVFAMYFL
jgi:hypothetical protein